MRWFAALLALVFATGAHAKPKPDFAAFLSANARECAQGGLGDGECRRYLRGKFAMKSYSDVAPFVRGLENEVERTGLTALSPGELAALADEIRRLPLDFRDEKDGCYGRAARIAYFLESRKKILAGQVLVIGDLRLPSRFGRPGEVISWGSHVAPVVWVRGPRGDELQVLDFTVFDGPAPLRRWLDRVTARTPVQAELIFVAPDDETRTNIVNWPPAVRQTLEDSLSLQLQ